MSINNTTEQLIEGVIKHGPDILEHCLCSGDLTQYKNRIYSEHLDYPIPPSGIGKRWFIPQEYCPDLIQQLHAMCKTDAQRERFEQEMVLFIRHNMLDVLYAMKYIVDTLRANNVVWGVGRGSSVASYVLYLIGVHKIDSIKYNLPIEEFFKEI